MSLVIRNRMGKLQVKFRRFAIRLGKNRSLIFLYLIVFIPMLTLGYFLFYDNYTYRLQEEIKRNEQMSMVLAQNMDSYLAQVKLTLMDVSILDPVTNNKKDQIKEIFRNLILTDRNISLYWVTDINGRVIAKFPDNFPDKTNKTFTKQTLQQQFFISEPRVGDITKMRIITLSTLVHDRNGKVIGVVGASIPLDRLQNRLNLTVGNSGFPILVTKSGKFLVHPHLQQISQKIKPDDPIFKTIQKGDSGTLDIIAPYDGKRKFFSYTPLKQANWVVIVVQPLSAFQVETATLFTRNTMVIILVFTILILAAYYLLLFRKREEESRILQAEKLAVVGELAAGMAHEIRNPLTSIKGFIQMAANRKDYSLAPEYLDIILSEITRIETIVNETMVLAKPTPVQFKSIDLRRTLEDVCTLMEPQALLHKVKVSLSSEQNLPLIEAEPNQIKQIFINLIRNAIEAMSAAGGEVFLQLEQVGKNMQITVEDNGCGIPPEILDKLGSPFLTTKDNGTGLGLLVTYRIVQNHHGEITATSTPGRGTVFTIRFPLRQVIVTSKN